MRHVPKLSFAQGQLMLWILAGSLVAFGAMFLFYRVSCVSLNTAPREIPRINFMPTKRQDPLLVPGPAYMIADVFDPSLMSLPSAHGFSKRAWARKIDASQRDLGWNEPPWFLGVAPPTVTTSLLQPVPVDVAVLGAAENAPAVSEEPNDQEVPEPPLSINQSVFRVLGALEDRSIAYAPPLPTIQGLAPLTPTQVRIGLDADGMVLYALLDRSSGDDAVDAQALALAKQFRFDAEHNSSPDSLTWGVLRFLWATQSASATNTGSTAPQH